MLNNIENPSYLFVAPADGAPYALTLEVNNSLFVGSGSSCRIVMEGEKIEPIHCMFSMGDQRVLRVQDWNTESGTVLNGQPISAETTLQSGDELEIGGNRIVPVLSRDVHQRYADRLADAEPVAGSTTVEPSPAAEPEVTPMNEEPISPINEEPLAPINEEPMAPSDEQPVRQVDEMATGDDLEPQSFAYDPLANLDEEPDPTLAETYETDAWDDSEIQGFDPDESLNEEVELLRMEVDQLRFELAERDAQLHSANESPGEIESMEVDDNETVQLVNRLEELLEELQSSDDRVTGLEELLRASDQATQDEREEREQLESWVTEIEQRLSQRESEAAAEMARLVSQLKQARTLHRQADAQLKKALLCRTGESHDGSNDLVQKLREQVEELQQQLESANTEIDRLRTEASAVPTESQSSEQLREMEQKLLQSQVESSRERAEISRQRAELQRLRDELEEKLATTRKMGKADMRVEAMRQHLREIHQEEKLALETKKQSSLSGRITRLLSRVSS